MEAYLVLLDESGKIWSKSMNEYDEVKQEHDVVEQELRKA
jgi:hypothetical protein